MSAILSADDLNDFISPGVACIKPVETLPAQQPNDGESSADPYQVTTEDKVQQPNGAPPAQISLTDCLACSGCVTSAEAVLVGLQSHDEVLRTLDQHHSVLPQFLNSEHGSNGIASDIHDDGMIFVASISPQTKANLAATYRISYAEAGYLIEQLLAGDLGLKSGGAKGNGFTWVFDTNPFRRISQIACIEEAFGQPSSDAQHNPTPESPILSSACPGWICYAEKTHPHILPYLSRIKSPQALAGTLLKSVLSRKLGVSPAKIWHLAVMPCFDKKLEASREELTDAYWRPEATEKRGVRDVDCVITAREVVMLADSRGISLPKLPQTPVEQVPFPDLEVDRFLFPRGRRRHQQQQEKIAGPSGGYAFEILSAQRSRYPRSEIKLERGRNADVIEYLLVQDGNIIMKTARYYGFRNIQNLVRRLKPPKKSGMPGSKLAAANASRRAQGASATPMKEYAYVEVMACPGGCTNGGGQIKIGDMGSILKDGEVSRAGPAEQKEWLARVDEAYYSADNSSDDDNNTDAMEIDDGLDSNSSGHANGTNISAEDTETASVKSFMQHWTSITSIALDRLLFTTYREVESDVGKIKGASDMDRVAGLASAVGGGW